MYAELLYFQFINSYLGFKNNYEFFSFQLFGYQNPITLQVFVGTDAGKVKPHGFYQACKVCGKNSTSCEEKDVDGTTVIDIGLDPKDEMKAR